MQPSLPLLDHVPARSMAQASRESWDHILLTLSEREFAVYLTLHNYCLITGHQDATGGELAEWSGTPTTSIRPRLTGLCEQGLIYAGTIRASRATAERRCHPYTCAVPIEAIRRAQQTIAREGRHKALNNVRDLRSEAK